MSAAFSGYESPLIRSTGQYCPQKYSVHFAKVYLDAIEFVSISIALYGLIVFYVLCKDELKGRKPLNKVGLPRLSYFLV